MTLRQKVALYEATLKQIAEGQTAMEVEAEAMMAAPDELYKHAFALGWMRSALNRKILAAQWALNQGAK